MAGFCMAEGRRFFDRDDKVRGRTRQRANASATHATLACAFAACGITARADTPAPPDPPQDPIVVSAPEPRFVAPTRFDRIGRIWVPVYIDEQGPFRLVLDTGASQTAVREEVAHALGATLPSREQVVLNGATGSRPVSVIPVRSVVVGDLELNARQLPIVDDALGGAQGVMGTDGLLDKRIRIEFLEDRISVQRSHGEPAPAGFLTIPVRLVRGLLVVEDATIGGVPAQVIIDTGGQGTVANLALRRALHQRARADQEGSSELTGATLDAQRGDRMVLPPMRIGPLRISPAEVTVGDFYIFQHWGMTQTPTVLLGMDVLGLVDTLIIDYARGELQVRTN